MEIKKVQGRIDGVKLLVVPKKSDIQIGDYCKIIKIPNEDIKQNNLEVVQAPSTVPTH